MVLTRILRPPLLAVLFAATASAQEAPGVTLDGNTLVLPSPIRFETGSAALTAESDPALAAAAAWLAGKTSVTLVRVEGHTSAEGSSAFNQKLSEARALAVARALASRGVDCHRLIAVGFGETKPIAANDTPEGRAANPRIEVVNAMLRGLAIGGMPADGGGVVAGDVCAAPG